MSLDPRFGRLVEGVRVSALAIRTDRVEVARIDFQLVVQQGQHHHTILIQLWKMPGQKMC